MYKRDVPLIVEYLNDTGPEGFISLGSFVICTIQMPLSRVKSQCKDIKNNGASSSALWGHKKLAYAEFTDKADYYHEMLTDRSQHLSSVLTRLVMIKGLGIPKASFLLQCAGWDVGCLDVHNLKRFKLDPKITKMDAKGRRITQYITVCNKLGGSEFLWDSWCAYVAGNRMNKSLPTADIVSAYHVEAITV